MYIETGLRESQGCGTDIASKRQAKGSEEGGMHGRGGIVRCHAMEEGTKNRQGREKGLWNGQRQRRDEGRQEGRSRAVQRSVAS